MDNKLPEACKHTKTVALEEIHADSQTAETKAGQIHSTVLSCSTVVVDLSPGSGEGPTRRERFKSDLQQASQEITILVTNHESPEAEMEEAEWTGESDTNPECMVPSEEDSLDVSMVVADLIELSQMQQTCLISNSSAEQSTSSDLPNTDGCRGSHKGETQVKSQHETTDSEANKSQSAEGVISSNSEDLKRSEKTLSNVTLKQGKSLEKSDSEGDILPRQQQHIQTQVSLEVVYHSAATSPMTPPEGSSTFFFPYSLNKLGKGERSELDSVETKDAELQVGMQMEYRSPELIPEPEPRAMSGSEEPPEPVQEVCWDEKGMTWEVYGAMVEVSVLGSAIQKHLEKQVLKKQMKPYDSSSNQTLPPNTTDTSTPVPSTPPALSASSRCSSAKGSRKKDDRKGTRGRQRRNPIRSFFRRPNCCSRVHSE
ncbi:hypothetical protein KOW79_012619 [Hemibagrus wyckioides]|uniref:G protein-regulated inducer of neurite outgrowth C-terminal domain-containing protein n=1 Tax=Hemibagrus wyckioides TaxID=337641 RepID=A0A9D3SM99_9TELE|nr:hypothetical protein KOW79_012619 [Hemibagrus wyckioides]